MYLRLVNQFHKGAELLQKSKILQQFSKTLHYQLCPVIGIPHIMCQSYYQLSQSICLEKKRPKKVHQITSNTSHILMETINGLCKIRLRHPKMI